MTLTVLSSNPLQNDRYKIRLVATQGIFDIAEISFIVEVIDECMTLNTMSHDNVVTEQIFTIGATTPLTFTFNAFTQTNAACGTITYTVTTDDFSTSLDSSVITYPSSGS